MERTKSMHQSQYEARQHERDGAIVYELNDARHKAVAEIMPEAGNNAISYSWRDIQVLSPPPNAAAFRDDLGARTLYGTPILFPPNRIKGGTYIFNGNRYQLPINEPPHHHLHGELLQRAWSVTDYGASNEHGAYVTGRIELAAHADIMDYFPHKLTFDVTHRLYEGRLLMEATISNHGKQSAPFAFGLHPYFHLPPEKETSVQLTVPAREEWPVTNEAFVTGLPSRSALAEKLNDGEGISLRDYQELGCSLVTLADGERVSRIYMKESGYRIAYETDRSFPFLVLFKPDWSSAFSLEPYTYVTDAFNLPYDAGLTGSRGIEPGEVVQLRTAMWVELLCNGE
ncbi:aldose 1-epimerase [Paenibacillus agaridevorans]|nr:aldose 1-epimerase [Paenibacillus agaridevorans]